MSTHPPEESGPEEHGRSGSRRPESGPEEHEPAESIPPESVAEQFTVDGNGPQPAESEQHLPQGAGPSETTPEDSEDSEEDFDRRWAEITERLGPLADPAAPGPRDYAEEAVEEEERFVPPDPGPLLPRDPRNLLPWSGAVGGPMAVLIILVFWPSAPPLAYFVALAATVAGLITIWWRLPQRRADSGGDNGAVV